jgi:hypothetical protein
MIFQYKPKSIFDYGSTKQIDDLANQPRTQVVLAGHDIAGDSTQLFWDVQQA